MTVKVLIVGIICLILITFILVLKIEFDKRQRINKEIIKVNKSFLNYLYLVFGFFWIILCIIFVALLIHKVQHVYLTLSEDVKSAYKLLDLKYIENLKIYFYENSMNIKYSAIFLYEGYLYKMIIWIIAAICNSIVYFYLGLQQNTICENGVFINRRMTEWDKVIYHEWSTGYESKLIRKKRYRDLIFKLQESDFLGDEIKLKVDYNNTELVNDVLRKYLEKENQI